MGHETAGVVAEIGRDVREVAEQDRVLVYLVWACGRCRPCIQGRDNVCVRKPVGAGHHLALVWAPTEAWPSTSRSKARYLEQLGDLDLVSAAPLADAGLTPMHAINGARHRLTPGATAVAIGIGGLGHMAVQLLKATSAVRVIAVDSDAAEARSGQGARRGRAGRGRGAGRPGYSRSDRRLRRRRRVRLRREPGDGRSGHRRRRPGRRPSLRGHRRWQLSVPV